MKGRILLVDDDPAMLKYCARLLTYEKYSVTPCANAAEAAAAINSGERYDILLTDFHLGDGYGAELIKLIKSVSPAAKAIIMTGDENLSGTRGPGPDYADAETLIKPFHTERMLSSIRELLPARTGPAAAGRQLKI
jgi:DNA-binding NtrC family response regulator